MTFRAPFLPFVGLILLTACGGGEGGGDKDRSGDGDGATSSMGSGGSGSEGTGPTCRMEFSPPGDLALDGLSQVQAESICFEYGEAFLCAFPESFNCRIEGIWQARQDGEDDPEVCRATEAACLENGSKSQEEYTDCVGTEIEQGCSVTVADAETCWQQLLEAAIALERPEFTCDRVAEYFEWRESLPAFEESDECLALQACN